MPRNVPLKELAIIAGGTLSSAYVVANIGTPKNPTDYEAAVLRALAGSIWAWWKGDVSSGSAGGIRIGPFLFEAAMEGYIDWDDVIRRTTMTELSIYTMLQEAWADMREEGMHMGSFIWQPAQQYVGKYFPGGQVVNFALSFLRDEL